MFEKERRIEVFKTTKTADKTKEKEKKKSMYKGIDKLAKLIKLMAKDVSKESSWWKVEMIGPAIGLPNSKGEISVTDDSGYRSITIGDTRGNRGYMLLYSENATYPKNERVWKYRCFPYQNEIARRLQKVVEEIPLISLDKKNCDSEEYWYSDRDEQTLKYFSSLVKRYADTIANDKRSAEKIYNSVKA